MSTPHRGLPPPSSMTLPDPIRQSLPSHHSFASIPAPPSSWHGQEESMRVWLMAKAEEDKRKQEEEKTRQESLRLEQRRIEQSMMHEALQAGVPTSLLPIIFAGMGGAHLAAANTEWLQQYAPRVQGGGGPPLAGSRGRPLYRNNARTRSLLQVHHIATTCSLSRLHPPARVSHRRWEDRLSRPVQYRPHFQRFHLLVRSRV